MNKKISFDKVKKLFDKTSDRRIKRDIEWGNQYYSDDWGYLGTPDRWYYGFNHEGLSVKALDPFEGQRYYPSGFIKLEFRGHTYQSEDIKFSGDEDACNFYLRIREKYENHQDYLRRRKKSKQIKRENVELRKKKMSLEEIEKMLEDK